jgi:hypothetical protein
MTRSNDLLVGGLTNLKNISQWERLSHILWKIKNVPNHQPERGGKLNERSAPGSQWLGKIPSGQTWRAAKSPHFLDFLS